MKRIIALVLSLAVLLACAAAMAETEQEFAGTLKVTKAFDIKYKALPDDYTLSVYKQDDLQICANILSPHETLPRMGLMITFTDEWAGTERLNDVSEEDMQAVKDDFLTEYPDLTFDIRETRYGTKLLVVTAPSGLDAYVYTIYKSHEIEIQIVPGTEQEVLGEADIERVVDFLSDMEFVPVEE